MSEQRTIPRDRQTDTRAEHRGRAARQRLLVACAGAIGGLVAGFAALAVAELLSAALRPESSPVTVVGGAAIDRTPPALKDFAVRHFGTDDKLVLELGILAVLALFAMAVGMLALRRRRTGSAVVLVFGAVGAAAAATRPDATTTDVLPSVVGAVAGCLLLYMLTGLASRPHHPYAANAEKSAAAPHGAPVGPGTGGVSPQQGQSGPATTSGPRAQGEAGTGGSPLGDQRTGPDTSDGSRARRGRPGKTPASDATSANGVDRRAFVVAATAAVAASAGAGALGLHLNEGKAAAAAARREDIVLPRPASPARPVPADVHPDVEGLSPFVTPNDRFYRVDTALTVPQVDATAWRLRIHGKGVRSSVTLGFQDLLHRSLIERDITLTCVSNQVGGPYAGTARWLGVPLADVLREAGVRAPSEGGPADQLVARSVDGMTLGTPVETVLDGRDAILALGMNGEPLPFAHGFPVRMVVPGLYGYVSACKWLTDLELTTFDAYDAYWVKRSWSREAPIKTESRIDTPRPFASPKAGTVPVAGVAWAQHRGIARVEVRVDGGPWHEARLAAEDSLDTWRQWVWPWPATPGSHTLEVRATDRTGATQTDRRVGTVPNGASGWHSVVVAVT